MTAPTYTRPRILISYRTSDLIREAARAQYSPTPSDEALKDDVAMVDRPLGGITGIGTRKNP